LRLVIGLAGVGET